MSMFRVFSCVVGRECLLWPVSSLGKTLLYFALLHSVLQGQIFLLLQVFLDFLLLHSSPPIMKRISFLGGEGNGNLLQYSCLENPMDGGAWLAAVHGVAKSQTQLSDFTFTFHFHALEKELATHSSVLAWRIPGTGELGGLLSMGSHRVGHDWSDLAAAETSAAFLVCAWNYPVHTGN